MSKVKFLKESKNTENVFKTWFDRINQIALMLEDTNDPNNALDIAFIVFPLMDSISSNLFGKDSYTYLNKLGLSSDEAAIVIQVFRNGYTHNLSSYNLEYSDGNVSWVIISSGGTGGIKPYDMGYISEEYPEDNIPAEKVLVYEKLSDRDYVAILSLDRLVALIKYDLQERQKLYTNTTFDFITGQKMSGKRPKIIK